MTNCPLTGSSNVKIIYKQKPVPLVQNRVYPAKELAANVPVVEVSLGQSLDNGFVFSTDFVDSIVDYDLHYQNEQSNSPFFRKHLEQVISIMKENEALKGKVVEIGCGKAYFMDMLLEQGVDITGFDPTYEGDSPKVVKDFFSDKYSEVGAEFIVLRHTLEHIPNPFDFIKMVAAINKRKGRIFIEVPTFDWIMRHNAVEDIFYEHCNYFTLDTLQMLFTKSIGGHFFAGQYIYVIADLADVNESIESRSIRPYEVKFEEQLQKYTRMIDGLEDLAVWGAGAKGSTFLNLLDKNCQKIKCIVDINPKKQHQYIGGTGHYVIKPTEIADFGIRNVIVMNTNYIDEIKKYTDPLNIKLVTL